MTKHDQIIHYIETLPIGHKISVRGIAKHLNMSEGTAYRAIKDAETLGIVSTIERVGTIRIEKKSKYSPDMLTFEEIVSVIEGEVLGGHAGLNNHLAKFIIGAMTVEAMTKYFSPGSLIIVGNRQRVQELALANGVAVLITGGFGATQEIIDLANQYQLPLISTAHDTFTVATLINRSMTEQMIKKEIVTVQDIFVPLEQSRYLSPHDTVETFHRYADMTGDSRFPVVHNQRLIGVVTAKDLIGKNEQTVIERLMTREPITVKTHMSVASVSHKMIWEDLEMLPVVADNLQLLGVVTRQDVMKAMQSLQQQPQIVHTYEDEVNAHLDRYPASVNSNHYDFRVTIQPQMISNFGTISYGVLCELITNVAHQKLLNQTKFNSMVEKLDLNYFNMIQLGNEIQFKAEIFYQNRRSVLSQVDVYHENSLVARAIVTSQIIEQN
ncbi:DRTGG domain-containing protein [Vaginisenegalia massiliensis]|uniref:DRTGG domain-containing protein n=1 Tax=Vaginisenegalia massiliensis TaxID=2058294 RepID=UPI003B9683A8